MKKDTLLQKLLCLVVVFLGSAICGLGIHLTLLAGIGVDPITLFEEGASLQTGLPVGTVAVFFNLGTMAIGFVLCRHMINWGSLVATLTVGSAINFWSGLITASPTGLPLQVALDVVGVLIIGLGISLYMLPDYGAGGLEAIMVYLSEHFNKPIGPSRVALDCAWGLVGILLGGTLGLGTLIGGVGIGMSIQLFYSPLRALVAKLSIR